ncbi:DUF4910 domain-containing protein, partial [Streptomyces sp. NPDC001889]
MPVARGPDGRRTRWPAASATLEIVGEYIPLRVHEVPTGTRVLDWTVPQE